MTKDLPENIKELIDQTKFELQNMSMFAEFKRHSSFSNFANEQIKLSAEFNKKKLKIIYQNLKNMLKAKIFENLNHVQKHLEESFREVFPNEVLAFQKYKRIANRLEVKLSEIATLRKQPNTKDVFIFTRLNKLQSKIKKLKEGDLLFKDLTEQCLQFNIESELNFQFLENLICFKNQLTETNKLHQFKNKIEILFEKKVDIQPPHKLNPSYARSPSMVDILNNPNLIPKISKFNENGYKLVDNYSTFHEKQKSFVSPDKSNENFLSALAFVEKSDSNGRMTLQPSKINWRKLNPDLRHSAITQHDIIKRNQKSFKNDRIINTAEKCERSSGIPQAKFGEKNKLFSIQNGVPIVSGLNIDFNLFQNILTEILDYHCKFSQINFKSNKFLMNPIACLLQLIDRPLNDRLTIDLRNNNFSDIRRYSPSGIDKLEKLNVFVLIPNN